MKNRYSLTFDIDWAPDFAIRYCLDLLDKRGASATFFATHNTPVNREIQVRGHTLGIHPNFLPNSSHGSNTFDIITECLSYSPDAWCMRTHSLVQSSPLLHEVFSSFSQIKLDVSLFMHRSNFAHKCIYETNEFKVERLLYNWADDAEFPMQRFNQDDDLFFGNLTVCDFHPIHVVLNSSTGSEYTELRKTLNGRQLHMLSEEEVRGFKNFGLGAESHLLAILQSNSQCVTLEEI